MILVFAEHNSPDGGFGACDYSLYHLRAVSDKYGKYSILDKIIVQ